MINGLQWSGHRVTQQKTPYLAIACVHYEYDDYNYRQIEMMRYASDHVLENYNYDKWLQHIIEFIDL